VAARSNRSVSSKGRKVNKADDAKSEDSRVEGASQRRLLVVDGANAIYRAFFAIPNLRSPDGAPTGAALGFLNMLRKMMREEAPDFAVVAMDPRGGSFRREIFEGYKATRDAQPEDLSAQIPLVREIIAALHIPVIEIEGFEADDVIATLAATVPSDVALSIVSSDKDLMQLVSDRVELVDGTKDRRYGPAEVEERFGVPPEQILDVRALIGDPSDNIPGVKGIGEKGAAKLIREFGTLEALLERAAEVSAKRAREALLESADDARLSKLLATLRYDVPLGAELEDLAVREPDREKLREIYVRNGFTRLLEAHDAEEGGEAAPAAEQSDVTVEFETLVDAAALAKWIDALALPTAEAPLGLLCVAGEGSVVDAPWVGLALAGGKGAVGYVPIADIAGAQGALPMGEEIPGVSQADAIAELARLFARDGELPWCGNATKRTQALLAERGLELAAACFDTEIAGYLIDPAGARDVSSLALQRLSRRVRSWEELAGRGAKAIPAAELEVPALASWAAEQAAAVRDLVTPLTEQMAKDGLTDLFDQVEMPLTRVLAKIERAGVRIDEQKLAALSEEYSATLASIEQEIYALAGESFAVNSPKQLQQILFEKLGLPALKKTKTGYSTDESVLEQLAAEHDLPARVLAWRRLAKLKSTYLDALPPLVSERSGRIHPTFLQSGAATGRLASTHPNVQNIPIRTEEGIRIREAFIPAEGTVLLSADYSQVELRILAHYSGDESLIDAFEKGEDIHRRTAAEVAGIDPEDVTPDQRARAKAVNFGIIYGSSAFGLANQLGIAQSDAKATIDAYFARYGGVRRFLDETVETAKAQGYVTTLLGRRRYFPDLASRNRVLRQAAERMAVNTVIQGSEADLIKRAMVDLEPLLEEDGLRARMILQVHDELVFEVPEAGIEALSALARERMKGVYALRVPLEVDVGVGRSWREAH
jgi:DNA polymerase-1